MGHALMDALPWKILPDEIRAFNWYAETSYQESFAMAFQTFAASITNKGNPEEFEQLSKYDTNTLLWFDHISKIDVFNN